ncbi:hypothetical protein JDN40_00230 [Rhodomicrobium vannielii ATCC 17100]|uniref:hypothetical protein n=1 Tax=Rhodomicrobium vannielii TaxID=1069 RepID=UPI00191AD0AB|nr:hypothetical protein [Rhodomicrobium vannielii]MBJ7532572.1 hypothetical protein [Rhodomicrobium vannielii ATCC 17100]
MSEQADIFGSPSEISLVRLLLVDLHDGLVEKVARFRQLEDLCSALGEGGTMMREEKDNAWIEARSSFVHANYMATVMLCQSLAENILVEPI